MNQPMTLNEMRTARARLDAQIAEAERAEASRVSLPELDDDARADPESGWGALRDAIDLAADQNRATAITDATGRVIAAIVPAAAYGAADDSDSALKKITLVRAVQTCWGCPSQWDAWDEDGQYYYLRYRSGHGQVCTAAGGSRPVITFSYGDPLDGTIELAEFARLAGITLGGDLLPYTDRTEGSP